MDFVVVVVVVKLVVFLKVMQRGENKKNSCKKGRKQQNVIKNTPKIKKKNQLNSDGNGQ